MSFLKQSRIRLRRDREEGIVINVQRTLQVGPRFGFTSLTLPPA